MSIVRRALLLVLALFLLWRSAALGLSAHFAAQAEIGDSDAASRALSWNAREPTALYAQALAELGENPAGARATLARAFAENPAQVRPLIALAVLAQDDPGQGDAESLVRAAVGLMPTDPWVRIKAASYWAARGDLTQAMGQWSLALEVDPGARAKLFPIFLKLAEDPRTLPVFQPLMATPPVWWEPFFGVLAKRALDIQPVRLLFAERRESARAPISEPERQAYVERLKRQGLIAEAYIEWVNGLSRGQRAKLGLLHDGGFELEPANWGFDWHLRSGPRALVDRAQTYGTDGAQGLHILFDRQERPFGEVYQPLFLDPGSYRLTGKVRTDSLDSPGGLKWVLRCVLPGRQDLGESERFLGGNPWRDFSFDFQVPDSCRLQELRLVSAGKRPFEHAITGGAWFDRMAIRRQAPSH